MSFIGQKNLNCFSLFLINLKKSEFDELACLLQFFWVVDNFKCFILKE